MLEPITVTVADACAMLGVKRTLLFALLKAGRLERCRFSSRTVVTVESIKRLVAESRVKA